MGTNPELLLGLSVLLFAAFPVAFTFLGRPVQLVLTYCYVASVLVVGGFFGSVYALPVSDSVTVSAGNVLYVALIFSSLLLVVTTGDPRVVRDIVRIVIAVNVFKIVLLSLTTAALEDPAVLNPFGTEPSVFSLSLRIVVAGGLLIVAELVLVVAGFEAVKTRVRAKVPLALAYVALFVAVLCLDGVLFPLIALTPTDDLATLIGTGAQAKLLLASGFGLPLLVYLLLSRSTLSHYATVPMPLPALFLAPREDLVEEISRQRHALAANADAYQRLVDSTGDAVVGTTLEGEVQSWNRAASELYRHAPGEVLGRPLGELVTTPRRGEIDTLLMVVSEGTSVSDRETTVHRPDGSAVEVSLTVSPVLDGAGRVAGASWIGRDVSARHQMQRALEHQAMHDALTGLPNRHLLADRLTHALDAAHRGGASVAVLFLDLDQFKMVNDSSGHPTGDQLLVDVAERFRRVLRAGETVARFGGDEFVVLCEDADAEGAVRVAQRLFAALEEPFQVGQQRVYMSASIGIALSPPSDPQALLVRADVAMYEAKARGRGRAQVYDESMATRTEGRLALANDLREALVDDRLELHYQPLVGLSDGRLVGAEALARWHDRERGQVAPDVFVPVAEDTGLVVALDRWAMRRAFEDGARLVRLRVLPDEGYVAVNLSAHTLSDVTTADFVRDAVDADPNGFACSNVGVEVTETLVMDDLDASTRALLKLRTMGIRVSIDDFGTGYSSLTYLRRLPAHVVKIDRSFIGGLTLGHEDLAIVTSIVQLAHGLGLRVVAEGVETLAQCALLRKMGCDAAQGFLWSAALPADDLATLVRGLPEGRFAVA